MIHHPIGITGLVLSVASALLLPKSGAARYTKDGIQILSWCSVRPKDDAQRRLWQRQHYIDKRLRRSAVYSLYFGFFLQAVDLLISA